MNLRKHLSCISPITCGWLLAGMILAGSGADAATALKWNWEPQQAWEVTFEQRGTNETTVNRRTVSVASEMDMKMTWQVEAVDSEGAATLVQTFDRIRFKVATDKQGTVEYDSASEVPPLGKAKELAAEVKPLVGASVRLIVDPLGKIQKVERIEVEEPFDPPAPSRLKELLSQEEMERILSQSFPQFPAEPVADGSQWQQQRTASFADRDLEVSTTYTFRGPARRADREVVQIETATDLVLKDEREQQESQELSLQSHEQTGVLYFDAEQGEMVESQVQQQLVTELPFRDKVIVTKATNRYTVKYARQ